MINHLAFLLFGPVTALSGPMLSIRKQKSWQAMYLKAIPPVDVVITMGGNVQCPFLPCSHREDWGPEDPSGKGDEAFLGNHPSD